MLLLVCPSTSPTSSDERPISAISDANMWRASCGVTFGPSIQHRGLHRWVPAALAKARVRHRSATSKVRVNEAAVTFTPAQLAGRDLLHEFWGERDAANALLRLHVVHQLPVPRELCADVPDAVLEVDIPVTGSEQFSQPCASSHLHFD